MDSGELDFYQHTKVCSNTCRSTKIDLTGARVSLTSQTSTEYIPLTPASADGTSSRSPQPRGGFDTLKHHERRGASTPNTASLLGLAACLTLCSPSLLCCRIPIAELGRVVVTCSNSPSCSVPCVTRRGALRPPTLPQSVWLKQKTVVICKERAGAARGRSLLSSLLQGAARLRCSNPE